MVGREHGGQQMVGLMEMPGLEVAGGKKMKISEACFVTEFRLCAVDC